MLANIKKLKVKTIGVVPGDLPHLVDSEAVKLNPISQ